MTDVLDRQPPEPAPAEADALELDASAVAPAAPAAEESSATRRLEALVSLVTVAVAVVFTVSRLHPALILDKAVPAGGDFGAHVWGPAYLRDHLLPHWRLSGWAPDWYAGFPMYRFYMVVPALLVVLIDLVVPYGVALKLISVLGIATLPVAAWALGRLGGARFPIPPLMALAAVVFLFDETFTIYGGNIASTMAGEFSFSIALSLGLLYLGLLAHGLRTFRHPVTTAVVLALAALCHGIVAMAFVSVGTVVVFCAYARWDRLRRSVAYVAVTGVVGGLLTAFWMLPFLLGHRFMTDMAYERRQDYWQMLFPQPLWTDRVLFVLAAVGFVGSIVRRRRVGVALGIMVMAYMVWAPLQPQGMLWNARLLPFLYLCRFFLVAVGVVEVALVVGRYLGLEARAARERRSQWWGESPAALGAGVPERRVAAATRLATAVGATAVVLLLMAMQQQILPGGREVQRTVTVNGAAESRYGYQWGPLGYTWDSNEKPGYVDNWAEWNYSGYEGKAAYGEYHGIVSTMQRLGAERGCGRALWENNNDLDKYGTPMALMLLPYWSDGCIGSMEGLFFEASGTTPYHFLTAAALSENSSNPVRRLRYENADVAKGVAEAKLLGVRYYLAFSPSVVDQADTDPELTPVATSGPWHVYEIAGAGQLVTPLANRPVVVEGANDSRDAWLTLGTSFFQDPGRYAVMPAADGPDDWPRVATVVTTAAPAGSATLPVVGLVPAPAAVPLPAVVVSDVRTPDQGISFTVDQVGVPVLVKTSYFPNWQVKGARGPYRVAPNLMVVVPTERSVSLHYAISRTDKAAYGLTLLGLALALVVWRTKPFAHRPSRVRAGDPDAEETTDADRAATDRAVDDDAREHGVDDGDPVPAQDPAGAVTAPARGPRPVALDHPNGLGPPPAAPPPARTFDTAGARPAAEGDPGTPSSP